MVARDITIERKIETELVKAQKFETIDLLAGGIAHDFNNILTGILGNISVAKQRTRQLPRVQERLETAEAACFRARELTEQLLTFTKPGIPSKRIFSIETLLQGTLKLALVGSSCQTEIKCDSNLWPVEADEGQIAQIFGNIIINARQSMDDAKAIRIVLENIPDSMARRINLVPAANYVKVSFEDQGPGISAEVISQIFEPYFTTKSAGSGLGLATAYAIAKHHGGTIRVESQAGEGAVFSVYLPATPEATLSEPKQHREEEVITGLELGRVLVLDDQPIVLETACAILEFLGYEACAVDNPEAAIEKYRSAQMAGKPFDVILLDLKIPGEIDARGLLERIRLIDPQVRAIITSGHISDSIMQQHQMFGFAGALNKPYDSASLQKVLASVLNQEPELRKGNLT